MPKNTFFFYDLETSGFDPRKQRIMQFAGQRTDMDLNPIGEPVNILVALSDEVLPDPGAIAVTGITPQKTREEGYSEAELCRILHEQVMTPGTIMTGFNNVRFDDEFMRYLLYRNFYDPYEWSWSEGRSRWDLMDVVRLTRAIRPEGMEWPVDANGKAVNKLELLAKANGLDHTKAHDALSDVEALIGLAKLIKQKQPKLFDYMLGIRDKKSVAELVDPGKGQPFVYASGRYDSAFNKTTVAVAIGPGGKPGSLLVYDLRHDPTEYVDMDAKAIAKMQFTPYKWDTKPEDRPKRVPVKELTLNRCPAVAPLGVLNEESWQRIGLSMETIQKHLTTLRANSSFMHAAAAAYAEREPYPASADVDARLYDGFIGDKDKPKMAAVRAADERTLADFHPGFADERLEALLLRYKARNFPRSMSQDEKESWEEYRTARIMADMPAFTAQLQALSASADSSEKQFIFEELQLWAESIAPVED